ncbi:MAG: peptidase M48, partial [Balneolaceae bacterium]
YEQTVLNEDRYMELIDGLVFGENPRHGFEEDGMFYHPELAFRFPVPGGWQLINQPSQVVLLSPEEDAVSIFRIDSESATPRQAVEAITSESGIEPVREEQALSSGEWEAWMAEAHAAMEDGTPLTLLVYAVEYENNIYRFLSYTGRDQYGTYEADFIAISESFDSLTDPGILDTRPVRINLTRADRSDSFESFLPDELPMDINPQEVAIINQVEMDDQIEAGQWLKIPVQE